MSEVQFELSDCHLDPGPGVEDYEVLLNPVAIVTLRVGEVTVWQEIDVPIVELAASLTAWLHAGPSGDFCYVSIEAEDECLLWFRAGDGSGWLGSTTSDGLEHECGVATFASAAHAFVIQATREATRLMGRDVSAVLEATAEAIATDPRSAPIAPG